jgi:serine/threonine protein kinase
LGRYALHDEVASGGMAAVHLGRLLGPVGFARTVAIKRLHPQFAKDPSFVAMFLDEARLASRIRHPNVVPTLDVVSLEDELFLVMEYVHGDSLARLQRYARARGEHIPIEVAVGVISHALHGLHAAHEAKSERGTPLEIVHRDVSPQNILVGTDGIGRVLDFGIAKASSRLQITLEGQLKGKLAYMAPEQLEHQDVDRRVDVWATAIVLWESLAGRRLFNGDHPARVMKAVLNDAIPKPSEIAADVPADLDAVVMKGLARDPNERWASARDMAVALEATGCVATQHAISQWVEGVAAESLALRSDRIAEIEGTALTGPNVGVGTISKPTTLPIDGTFAATDRDIRDPNPNKRKTIAIAAAAGIAVLLGGIAIGSLTRRPQPEASATGYSSSSSSAAAATTPPPATTTAPTPTPTPPPAAPSPSQTAKHAPTHAPTTKPTTKPATKHAPSKACDPPYTVGKDGVKKPKLECL